MPADKPVAPRPRPSRAPIFAALGLAACGLLSVGPAVAADAPFRDATAETGLDFIHFNGMTGEMYYPEIMGPGAALFDADGDGDLDVYLAQGALLGSGKKMADALRRPAGATDAKPPRDRLFRNDLTVRPDGRRSVRFVDVTETALPPLTGYGMAVAAGDVDNDGDVDLYVLGLTDNHLLRNRGDGTFEDVTVKAGVTDNRWSAAATFDDLDRDGDLDLFVVDYLEFPLDRNPTCNAPSSRRDYCGPSAFAPYADRLYLNRGDGTFESAAGRLLRKPGRAGPGLGVVAADLTGDHRTDLYVANDGAANHFWVQQPDGTFVDDALLAGLAVNRQGRPEAGMGVTLGDVDTDGDFDLLVTHLDGESNTLYLQQGGGLFEDHSAVSGLGAPSLPFTAFGTGFLDVDNDGDLDLLAVNGAVRIEEDLARKGDPYPLGQRNQLFENVSTKGPPRFREWTAAGGRPFPAFADVEVSRGATFGDVDNDGDLDVLVINNAGPARLLLNEVGAVHPWLGLRVVDDSGRDALGTLVEVRLADGRSLWRRVHTDGSFASANDPRVLFGFGSLPAAEVVRVHWRGRSGEAPTVEEWSPRLGRYSTLRKGQGKKSDDKTKSRDQTERPQ